MFSKKTAYINNLGIGGDNPIRIQTMYDSQICDTDVNEVIRRISLLQAMGCDIIRFSYVSSKDKENFTKIIIREGDFNILVSETLLIKKPSI